MQLIEQIPEAGPFKESNAASGHLKSRERRFDHLSDHQHLMKDSIYFGNGGRDFRLCYQGVDACVNLT
jgi:hypothetical protein